MFALSHDFHSDRSLPGNHLRVIEGVDEGETLLQTASLGFLGTLVIGLTMQNHLTTKGPNRSRLHLRCGAGHHDHRTTAESASTEGDALGVVAGARRDHATTEFISRQLGHPVVSAPELEGKDWLQVLSLQPDAVLQPPAQIGCWIQWCLPRDVIDARTEDPLQIVGHPTILSSPAAIRQQRGNP